MSIYEISNPVELFLLFIKTNGWILFIPIIIFFFIKLYLNYKRLKARKNKQIITLAIDIPKFNEQFPKGVENIFTQISATFDTPNLYEKWISGFALPRFSFEIVSIDSYIQFIIRVEKEYANLISSAIYAQYPSAQIVEIKDYTKKIRLEDIKKGKLELWGGEYVLKNEVFFPIRTYQLFEHPLSKKFVDPLLPIFELMASLEKGEQIWYHISVQPTNQIWQAKGLNFLKNLIENKEKKEFKNPFRFILSPIGDLIDSIVQEILGPRQYTSKTSKTFLNQEIISLSPDKQVIAEAVKSKIFKQGLVTRVRLLYISEKHKFNKQKIIAEFQGVLNQINTPNLNQLTLDKKYFTKAKWPFKKYKLLKKKLRVLKRAQDIWIDFEEKKSILNTEELATLWHFPLTEIKISSIKSIESKKLEPPADIPECRCLESMVSLNYKKLKLENLEKKGVICIGETNFRGVRKRFGIKQKDRNKHFYIIGKTGMGKTTLIENMVISDIYMGRGVAVIDPHGDLIERILNFIPSWRINDTIYFNPQDTKYPIGFNVLEIENPNYKYLTASSLISVFKKIWADSWGPRLEYVLRNAILALIDFPSSTLLGIIRMLSEKEYRKKIVRNIKDPVVRHFWEKEYSRYSNNFQVEAISPIQNKVGQFISIPIIRNIIGQVRTRVNFREVIDSGKILLVNLAKGIIGEDTALLLGTMLVNKLQIAAMSRADLTESQRKDFYLYVDEFQNFTTEGFVSLLSEARKYHLNLIIAHQYISQLDDSIKSAVLGNVGTIVIFRLGAEDAQFLEPEVFPDITASDLVNLGRYEIVIKLMIDGIISKPFTATTLPPLKNPEIGHKQKIIKLTRERYTIKKEKIEDKITRWLGPPKFNPR